MNLISKEEALKLQAQYSKPEDFDPVLVDTGWADLLQPENDLKKQLADTIVELYNRLEKAELA